MTIAAGIARVPVVLAMITAGVGCYGGQPGPEETGGAGRSTHLAEPPSLPDGWHVFSRSTPGPQQLACASFARQAWQVAGGGPHLTIREWLPGSPRSLPLPFKVPSHDGLPAGDPQHAVRLASGWLTGYDTGEFGGGLWWFGVDGENGTLLAPENVQGIAQVGASCIALLGPAHSDSGRVVMVSPTDSAAAVVNERTLAKSPDAFAVTPDGAFLIATSGGLLRLTPGFELEVVTKTPYVFPNSVAVVAEDLIYVGMRAFVVRLTRSEEGWREDWLTATPCPSLRRVGNDCVCVDG